MRRVLLVSLLVIVTGAIAARGTGAGLYSGWPEVFGIQFVTEQGWRMSVGLTPGSGDQTAFSVAVSLDLLPVAGAVYADEKTADVNYYAGAGVMGSLLRANPELNGHALLGLQAYFVTMENVGLFGELQLGQQFWFSPFSTRPFLGFRVGVSLQ
ncbi:hypothetical protein [Oceanithermus sp.]